MELEGEIYSPSLPLGRARLDLIERDIWNCAYPGICHSVYRYGSQQNGGGYCREVTDEVAARLGRLSFAAQDEVRAPVRAFLEAMGVSCREDAAAMKVEPAPAFEMVSPPEPAARARHAGTKRRARPVSAEELRAQPQLKLPIAGGRAAAARAGLRVAREQDEEIGVESLSLKDRRPAAQQKAGWERFRRLIRSWEAAGDAADRAPETPAPPFPTRRSAQGG